MREIKYIGCIVGFPSTRLARVQGDANEVAAMYQW